jgi:hypothetical protein
MSIISVGVKMGRWLAEWNVSTLVNPTHARATLAPELDWQLGHG